MSKKIKSKNYLTLLINSKKLIFIVIGFIAGFGAQQVLKEPSSLPSNTLDPSSCQLCFTPSQSCLPLILKNLKAAKQSIHLQGYFITSKSIADEVIRAYQRGVTVTIIADKSQRKTVYSKIINLLHVGIPVYIDNKPAIAHNKVIIIDETIVLTGSYNWTDAAEEKNAENLLIINNVKIAQQYLDNFKQRLAVSEKLLSVPAPLKVKRNNRR